MIVVHWGMFHDNVLEYDGIGGNVCNRLMSCDVHLFVPVITDHSAKGMKAYASGHTTQ